MAAEAEREAAEDAAEEAERPTPPALDVSARLQHLQEAAELDMAEDDFEREMAAMELYMKERMDEVNQHAASLQQMTAEREEAIALNERMLEDVERLERELAHDDDDVDLESRPVVER